MSTPRKPSTNQQFVALIKVAKLDKFREQSLADLGMALADPRAINTKLSRIFNSFPETAVIPPDTLKQWATEDLAIRSAPLDKKSEQRLNALVDKYVEHAINSLIDPAVLLGPMQKDVLEKLWFDQKLDQKSDPQLKSFIQQNIVPILNSFVEASAGAVAKNIGAEIKGEAFYSKKYNKTIPMENMRAVEMKLSEMNYGDRIREKLSLAIQNSGETTMDGIAFEMAKAISQDQLMLLAHMISNDISKEKDLMKLQEKRNFWQSVLVKSRAGGVSHLHVDMLFGVTIKPQPRAVDPQNAFVKQIQSILNLRDNAYFITQFGKGLDSGMLGGFAEVAELPADKFKNGIVLLLNEILSARMREHPVVDNIIYARIECQEMLAKSEAMALKEFLRQLIKTHQISDAEIKKLLVAAGPAGNDSKSSAARVPAAPAVPPTTPSSPTAAAPKADANANAVASQPSLRGLRK